MEPNNTDAPEVLETQEVAAETTETSEESELTPEVIADLKAKAAKADELEKKNKQLFERAKKAEAAKSHEIETTDLSTKDVLYLAKADVHEDDVNEVLEWAKFKKITVSDAHKQLKATLQVRAEERKSAETANISPVRRGPSKATDDTLLENAKAGKLPESDDDIMRLVAAKTRAK
jgi:hypothetical protein